MRPPKPVVILTVLWVLGSPGCSDSIVCTDVLPDFPADGLDLPVILSSGDPYEPGTRGATTYFIDSCTFGAPVPMFVHTPQERNTYASVLFLHGWKSLPQTYDTILQHLASHGFVVIVPQLVSDCTEFVLGDPTLEEQAGRAAAVIDWAQLRLSDVLGMEVNTRRMGLAGHSLGGKVAWLLMQRDDRLLAVAAIDPVDVTAIPLGNDDAVTADLAPLAVPGFVIGAGIRGACSFEGANHWDFFNTLASPAWHMVATDYGHQDMLDERDGALARRVCGSGPDRDGMRRLVGGALAAFFRGELQYEDDAHRYLSDSTITPVAVELDAR